MLLEHSLWIEAQGFSKKVKPNHTRQGRNNRIGGLWFEHGRVGPGTVALDEQTWRAGGGLFVGFSCLGSDLDWMADCHA